MLRTYWCLSGLLLSQPLSWALADQFHYQNTIVGDRALGLGGAYTAVSDDASGVVYNPAGLAFSLSSDISGSANAFNFQSVEYKETIGDASFTENSKGKFAPFLGALQKLDHISPGLAFAFGLWSSDSELKDQDDYIRTDAIPRFHRTVNARANTDYIGIALAKRFRSNFSVGFGLNYIDTDELLQEYQDALTIAGSTADGLIYQVLNQNIRQRLMVQALEPTLGIQYVLGKWTIGLMAKYALILNQTYENTTERHVSLVDGNLNVYVDPSLGTGRLNRTVVQASNDSPIGNWPLEARFGTAYFASTELLWTFDVIYRGAASGDISLYDRNAVTNLASGLEYYLGPSFPLRMAYFSNFDSRDPVEQGLQNQRDYINYHGGSLFIAWVQPNSSVSVGAFHQIGQGKAQKIGQNDAIQEVEAESTTYAFSATHNF